MFERRTGDRRVAPGRRKDDILHDAPKLQLRGIYWAGPVISAMICGLVYLIVWGKDWDHSLQQRQLDALAYTLFALTGILALVIVALSSGLISSLNISVGALKASVNLDNDDSPPAPQASPAPTDVKDTAGG